MVNPVAVCATGNCLFNSASLYLQGTESRSAELREALVKELKANSQFYANHQQFIDAAAIIGVEERLVFSDLLSITDLYDPYDGTKFSLEQPVHSLVPRRFI